MKPFPDSIPPLDNNSILVGFPDTATVVRSKPFMQYDEIDPDYEGQDNYSEHKE